MRSSLLGARRHVRQLSRRQRAVETEARALLLRGDVAGAGAVVARLKVERREQGLGFDWRDGHPDLVTPAILLEQEHAELSATPEQRRAVAIELAVSCLFGTYGEDSIRVAEYVLLALGGRISCPALEAFMLQPCNRYVATYRLTEPLDVAQVYMLTMHTRAAVQRQLQQLRSSRNRLSDIIGVKILPVGRGQPCAICDAGPLALRWEEFERSPAPLPRHWGCRCVYLAWLREVESK